MKRCSGCKTVKPYSDFPKDRSKPDGCKSRCKPCYGERQRAYRLAHPELYREAARRWAQKNPEKVRARSRRTDARRALNRHDGPEERARMFVEQNGCCFMCKRPFLDGDKIVVDHDHDCCPSGGRTDSCRNCRRGLAHEPCNQIVGLCREDMDVLRAIAANFEPVRDAAKARIGAVQAQWLEGMLELP